MKRSHKEIRGKGKNEKFLLQFHKSDYSKIYARYLQTQYHSVQQFIKALIKKPFCREYYLKYPLQGLLKGICKKLLINLYQFVLFGYFLSQVEWKLDHYIYNSLAQVFPNVIHVNQPTDAHTLKHLSMFLYFSSYAIKQFLNEDMRLLKLEMIKIFPEFQHLQAHWTSNQQTVGQILNPKVLNTFYKGLCFQDNTIDLNTCVDKILQISPCYDITKNDKPKDLPNFGFMQNDVQAYGYNLQERDLIKLQENMEDYQFDGDI